MDNAKHIHMNGHQAMTSIAVLNFSGKQVMECVIATKASTLVQIVRGLRGDLHPGERNHPEPPTNLGRIPYAVPFLQRRKPPSFRWAGKNISPVVKLIERFN